MPTQPPSPPLQHLQHVCASIHASIHASTAFILAVLVGLLTVLLTAAIAFILYYFSCKHVSTIYSVPSLTDTPSGATCELKDRDDFIIGETAESSRAMFGKDSYIFNYTNSWKIWNSMARAIMQYKPAQEDDLALLLTSADTINVNLSTFATPTGTYVLSFARRDVRSKFNRTAYTAMYSRLLRGGPSAIALADSLDDAAALSNDNQDIGDAVDGDSSSSSGDESSSEEDTSADEAVYDYSTSAPSAGRRRLQQQAAPMTDAFVIKLEQTGYTTKFKPTRNITKEKPASWGLGREPEELLTREECTWAVRRDLWEYFLSGTNHIPDMTKYRENALNLEGPECCTYVANDTQYWCASLRVQANMLANTGNGVSYFYRNVEDQALPLPANITDEPTRSKVFFLLAASVLNDTIMQFNKTARGRFSTELEISLANSAVLCEYKDCTDIPTVVGSALGYAAIAQLVITYFVLCCLMLRHMLARQHARSAQSVAAGGRAMSRFEMVKNMLKDTWAELLVEDEELPPAGAASAAAAGAGAAALAAPPTATPVQPVVATPAAPAPPPGPGPAAPGLAPASSQRGFVAAPAPLPPRAPSRATSASGSRPTDPEAAHPQRQTSLQQHQHNELPVTEVAYSDAANRAEGGAMVAPLPPLPVARRLTTEGSVKRSPSLHDDGSPDSPRATPSATVGDD